MGYRAAAGTDSAPGFGAGLFVSIRDGGQSTVRVGNDCFRELGADDADCRDIGSAAYRFASGGSTFP